MMNKQIFALTGIILIVFVAFFEYTVVTTAAPTIQTEFNVSVLDLQWILNIYSVVMVSTMILWGRLGDLYGRRLMFYAGTVILLLGSIGAGLAGHFWTLIFFRGIQSLGVASTVTLGPSLILNLCQQNAHRPMSIYGTMNGIALSIGPTVGGFIVMHLGWRYIFLINVPLLIIALLCCLPFLPESKAQDRPSLDPKGALLLVLTIVSLIYGLIRGAESGWHDSIALLSGLTFIISLPLLIWVENRQEHPIMNFHFFTRPIFLLAALACTTGGAFVTVAIFFSPLFLQRVMAETPKQAGLLLLAIPIAVIFFAPFVGKVIQKIGVKLTLLAVPVISLISSLCYLSFSAQSSLIFILFTFLIIGFAWGITIVAAPIAAGSAVSSSQSSIAMGTVFATWNIAAAIAITIGSIIFNVVYAAHHALDAMAYADAFRSAFIFVAIVMALLLGMAIMSICKGKPQ